MPRFLDEQHLKTIYDGQTRGMRAMNRRMKKRQQRIRNRRRLITEPLEDRRLLAALDFLPTTGAVTEENGNTVVTVAPGETINVAAQIVDAESDVLGFQLNLASSDAALALSNFSNGEFPGVTDDTLDSSANDFLVASGIFTGPLPAPPVRLMGSFDVTVPNTPNDYVLTSNQVAGANDDTILSDGAGSPIAITDFGDLIIRVTDSTQPPVVQFTTATQDAAEDTGDVTITARLSQTSDSEVTIPFTVTGTATVDSDFSVTTSPISIPAGQTSASITVSITDDTETEPVETVVVTLDTPTGAALGASTVHTINVEDNDTSTANGLALDLVPSAVGEVTEENGQTVVTVTPGTPVTVSAVITESSSPVLGFQLNLSASSGTLVLNNFVNGDFSTSTDDVLDSSVGDFEVASGIFLNPLTIPPDRLVGQFDATPPTAPGDYLVSTNVLAGLNNDTIFSDVNGNPIAINDFGDLIIRVAEPPPIVNFTTDTSNAAEDAGTITVTAELSAATGADVTLPFTITGTATNGSDFTITTSPITITAGQTSGDITISVIDDTDVESAETVVVTLDTPTGADLGATTVHTATIEDNDVPTVSLDSAFQNADEDAGTVSVTATLSAVTDVDVTIPFSVSGTATSGTDFTITTSPLVIPAGQTSADISVAIIDDSDDEPDETVVITLATPGNADLGTTIVHTLTIADNDEPVPPSVAFSTAAQSVDEDAGTISITAVLSEVTTSNVLVPFTVSGTATDGSDYTITGSTLLIVAGQTTADLPVTIIDDSTDEPDETIVVTIGTPTGATVGAIGTHTITIADNDEPPLPTVSLSTASQSGDEDGGALTVTAVLSETAASDVTVPFTVTGTATNGSDFTISTSPITIAAGQTSANITITPIDDTDDEPDETVIVTLGTPTGATVAGTSTHTATIVDDDPPAGTPVLNFSAATQSGAESVGTLVATITASEAPTADLSIPFTVTGTASDGSDFTITASPVTLAAGQTSVNISINVIDDSIDEIDETVELVIQSTTGAVLGANVTHTATITDNDEPAPTPIVTLSSGSQSVAENGGTINITVNLSNAADEDVTIPFSIEGTATDGSDFTISASPLVIPAGTTSGNITVSVIDDTIQEPNETVVVTMGAVTGGISGSTTVQVITINDNESVSNGNNRIIIPNFVARPHVIPGDGQPTAILFKAEVDTQLTVGKVNVVSLLEQVVLLNEDLTSIGGIGTSGLFEADLMQGGLYALIFQGRDEDAIFVIRSSEGFETLTGTQTNLLFPTDVNADGESTTLDALLVINRLRQLSLLEGEEVNQPGRYYDVNRDGQVSASDVLQIINGMARQNINVEIPLGPGSEIDPGDSDPDPIDGTPVTEEPGPVTSVDLSQPIVVVDLSSAVESGERVDEVLADETALDDLLASLI